MIIYSIIIPCYKSSKTIETVVDNLRYEMDKMGRKNYEIILVNDCSPDQGETIRKLEFLAKKYCFVKVIDLAKNVGQHNAVMAGLRSASGEIIISMDDDMQTRPCELPKMFDAFDEGYDVVYGYYLTKREGIIRRIGSWFNQFCARYFLRKPSDVTSSSFWIIRKYIKDSIIEYHGPYSYLLGLILRATNNIKSVVVEHYEREYGNSGYTFKSLFKLWSNLIGFTARPLHTAVHLGMMSASGAFLAIIVIIFRKVVDPGLTVGWASTIVAIFFALGVLLIFMGVIGEYIGRMYLQVNGEPQYVIKNKIGFDGSETYKDDKKM